MKPSKFTIYFAIVVLAYFREHVVSLQLLLLLPFLFRFISEKYLFFILATCFSRFEWSINVDFPAADNDLVFCKIRHRRCSTGF